MAVTPATFADHLARLDAAGFTTLTACAAAAALGGGDALPSRPLVLTFDDGFADFHSRVLPLLARYGFTATLFITTGWIDDAGADAAGRRPGRMLSWSQIGEAADVGVEVAAHSHRHAQLDQLADVAVRRELHTCKALLEDRLGRAVPGLAYPFGYSSARVRRAVRESGYQYGCAVGNMIATPARDPFALPRLTIKRSTQPRAFDRIVRGQGVPLIFLKDRSLTKGWALIRRTRAAVGSVSHRG